MEAAGRRRGFWLPDQLGILIEAVIIVAFLGLFILGGIGLSNAWDQFVADTARESLKDFRDRVESGCQSGSSVEGTVHEEFSFDEEIRQVEMASSSIYEATLQDGNTVPVETGPCTAAHICDGGASEGCAAGTLPGGSVELELRYEESGDGDASNDVVWIGTR